MTTFTVTATQGGSTAVGMALRVFVLTQAAASQPGGVAGNQFLNVTSFTQTVTTTQTGSRVYGACYHSPSLTSTPAAATTIVDDIADGTNNQQFTTFKATALTGTPGATTLGFTVASSSTGPLAEAEILTAGTLTEDASGPAVVSTTSLTAVTTASFTPPAGSLLVALVCSDGGVGVTTMALTDTSGLGLTWVEQVHNNPAGGDYAGVWTAQIPAAVSGQPPQPGSRAWRQRFRKPQSLQWPTPGPPPPPPVLPGLLKGPPAARPGKLTSAVAPPLPPPPFQPPQPGSRAWRQRFRKPQTPQGPLPAPPVTVPLILPLARGAPAALKGTTGGTIAPPPVVHPSVPSPFYAPHTLLRGAMAAVKGKLASTRGLVPVPLVRGLMLRGQAGIKGKTFGQAAPPPVTYPSKPIPQHSLLQPAPHAATGKTFGQAAPPPVTHPSVPAPFFPPHGLLRGAMAAARGKLAWVRGRPGVPATFTPPPAPLKGTTAAFRGKLAGIIAPPPPAVPVIPAPFALPRTLLHPAPPAAARGKLTGQAGRPGVPAPFFAPHSLLKPAPAAAARGTLTRAVYGRPGVPAPFTAPHAPLRGVMAARKGTIAGVTAPPPVVHPSVPAPFFPPHSLLAGRTPARARTPLTGIIAPPPVINPPNLYLGIWQGSTHHIAPPAGNVILGANHPGPGSGTDKRGDFERSGD
jgi:hypothetical protein